MSLGSALLFNLLSSGARPCPWWQRRLHLSARWCKCCWVLPEGRGALGGALRWNWTLQFMFSTLCKGAIRWVNQNYCLKGSEKRKIPADSRWHLEYWSEWTQVLIHCNGRIFVLNAQLLNCKGLLSPNPFSFVLYKSVLRCLWGLLWFLHHVPGHLGPGSRRELSLLQALSLCFCPSVWEEYEISLVTTFF